MKFLLDTNICIYLIKKKTDKILKKLQTLSPEEVGISVITLSELEYGVLKSQRRTENGNALALFLTSLQVLPFDEAAAKSYAGIRASLEKEGRVIGVFDMLIAAHALSLGWTCVTNNEREFSRVAGLRVVNWV